jgi:hypothetical protein
LHVIAFLGILQLKKLSFDKFIRKAFESLIYYSFSGDDHLASV